jgi:hypothetical protein
MCEMDVSLRGLSPEVRDHYTCINECNISVASTGV